MYALVRPRTLLQSLAGSFSQARAKKAPELPAISALRDAVEIYAGTTDRKVTLGEIIELSTNAPRYKISKDAYVRGAENFRDFIERDINGALFEVTKFASFQTMPEQQKKLSILISNTLTILAAYDYFKNNASHALYNVAQLNQLNTNSPCKELGAHIETGSALDQEIAQTAKTIAIDLYDLTEEGKKQGTLRNTLWFAWDNAASMQNPSTPGQYADLENKNSYTQAFRLALKEAFLYIYDPMTLENKNSFLQAVRKLERKRDECNPHSFVSYVSAITSTPKVRATLCPDMC